MLSVHGDKKLFINLKSVDLPLETCEKLKSIKSVVEMFDEEGGQA